MRALIAAALLLIAQAAQAKEITITLSEDEQRALTQILDVYVKQSGLSGAQVALYFVNKLKVAADPTPPPEPKQ